MEDRGKISLVSDINSEFISEASVSVFVRGQRREDNHSKMAEGSGSEPASVPPTSAPATATVSYAKIAAVTSDNDPAAAVIVVNKEDTAASESQGLNSIHFRVLTKIFTKKFTKIFTKKLSKFILKNFKNLKGMTYEKLVYVSFSN